MLQLSNRSTLSFYDHPSENRDGSNISQALKQPPLINRFPSDQAGERVSVIDSFTKY